MLCFFDFYDNYTYKGDWNKNVSVYKLLNIIKKQFICYFDSKNWEN